MDLNLPDQGRKLIKLVILILIRGEYLLVQSKKEITSKEGGTVLPMHRENTFPNFTV